MENNSSESRSSFAKKILETPKQSRKEILQEARQTEEYQQARNEHISENQEEESINDGLGILLKRKTLYHGSPIGGIDTFERAENDTIGAGVYFTSQAKDAIGYARFRLPQHSESKVPKLYESHVENLKLLDLRNGENILKIMPGFAEFLAQKLEEYRLQKTLSASTWVEILTPIIQKIKAGELKSLKEATFQTGHLFSDYVSFLGYAGIAALEGGEGNIGNHDTYLVFDPKHIAIRKEQNIS
jgi:hypothetical protein